MQIESDATRLLILKATGATLWRAPDGEFWAIFESEYAPSNFSDTNIEDVAPALTLRTSDVRRLALVKGVLISGKVDAEDAEFTVRRHEPDGTGMSQIILGP